MFSLVTIYRRKHERIAQSYITENHFKRHSIYQLHGLREWFGQNFGKGSTKENVTDKLTAVKRLIEVPTISKNYSSYNGQAGEKSSSLLLSAYSAEGPNSFHLQNLIQ